RSSPASFGPSLIRTSWTAVNSRGFRGMATYQKGTIREASAQARESSTGEPCLDWDAVLTRGDYKEPFRDAARAKHPHAGRTWRAPAAVTAGAAGGGRGAGAARDRPGSLQGAETGPRSRGLAGRRGSPPRIVGGAARPRPGRPRRRGC